MIRSLSGKLMRKSENSAVVLVGGVGFKVAIPERVSVRLPGIGNTVELFTHLHVREDALDLFGFTSEESLRFFELLISISGVGPKSALSILDVAELEELEASIAEGRPDLLTKASGIGRKTAERVVLELKGKVFQVGSGKTIEKMDADSDVLDALISLGYRREEARSALQKVPKEIQSIEVRLKEALKVLARPNAKG